MKRILTALILIPIVVYVVLWANFWIFLAVLVAVAFLCWREYDTIAATYGFGAPGALGCVAGYLWFAWRGDSFLFVVVLTLLCFAMVMRVDELEKALPRAALFLAAVIYVFGTWKCAIPLRQANPHWLMFALLLNWAGDIGAFYFGSKFGRHKLASRVSPKKSWEGSVASVATSILIAGAYLWRFIPELPLVHIVALTASANIAGQIGDLAES